MVWEVGGKVADGNNIRVCLGVSGRLWSYLTYLRRRVVAQPPEHTPLH